MAGNITPFYFLTLFDEFKAVVPEKIQAYIDIASLRVPPLKWGQGTARDVSSYATALLTAHMLATSGALPGQGGGPGGGVLTSEQVGDVSRAFAKIGESGSGDEALMTTRYGIDFVALRKETILPFMITGPATNPPPTPPDSNNGWFITGGEGV